MDSTSNLPVGTVTFLFTDIEGSTRLLRELGSAYAALLADHQRRLRDAVESEGGAAVSTEGDSVFASFSNAPAALRAAVRAQKDLASMTRPEERPVLVRMGLHTGDGVVSDGNYVGIDVHRAARIAAAAHGGQILVSDSTRSLVETSLPDGVHLRDLGRHRLKDLPEPEHIYQASVNGLPTEFPALRSLEAAPNNLPTEVTSFVGRAREVAEARRLLTEARLLTLTGPGGTGKTRLSLRLAGESAADFPDGIFFVALGAVEDPALVAPTIGRTLGLREIQNQTVEQGLADYLRDRCLLLILDNFEQVAGAAGLVADLVRAAPGIRIVVTSRAMLHLYGEREFEVPPLGLPATSDGHGPDPAELGRSEAGVLFVERARAVKPGFEVTPANAAPIAAILARLDGLPLAIELVAARVRLLPPQALLARLERLDDLIVGPGDLPARQRTLRGAIAWSYDLLDPEAKRLFARLGVFAEGASLEAVEAVCGFAGEVDVLEGLSGLVDQSLVRQEEVDGEPRFTMLLTIRDFALEQLAASGEDQEVCRRHAAFYLDLAETSAPGLTGADQRRLLDRLGLEYGNIRAALTWTIERGETDTGLRLGAATWRFWQMRGLLQEGAGWLERLLALPDASTYPEAYASALEAAGGVAYWRAEMDSAMRYYQACLEHCRRLGDRRAIANALYNWAFPFLVVKTDVARSLPAFQESLAIFRELGDRGMVARVLWGLGNAYYFSGNYQAARDTLLEDLELFRPLEDHFSLAWAQHTLGLTYIKLGEDWIHARPLWRAALQHFAEVGDVSGITLLLGDFGLLARARGDTFREIRLAAASTRLASEGGAMLASATLAVDAGEPDIGSLDPSVVAAATGEGRAMTIAEAVEYALEGDVPPIPRASASIAGPARGRGR